MLSRFQLLLRRRRRLQHASRVLLFLIHSSIVLFNLHLEVDENSRSQSWYVQHELDLLPNAMIKHWLRFDREEIRSIIPYLALETVIWPRRIQCDPETALSVLLARLSWPQRGRDLEVFIGRSRSWISLVFNATLRHLWERYRDILHWHPVLNYERMEQYALQFEEATGAVRVWGFLDGTFRSMCRPTYNQRYYYSGYKKSHGFKFQGIVTPDGLVLSLIGPFEGKINDANTYMITGMKERLKETLQDRTPLHLFGDSAYESFYRVLTPYKQYGPLSRREKIWNEHLSQNRISVEQVFGYVQNNWHANSLEVNLQPLKQAVASWYAVAVLMANVMTCLRGNVVSTQFGIDPLSLEEYLGCK